MSETILEVKNVTKTYPGVVALDNVSLEFRKGEVHALVGENGAGKSTIIKCIAGAIQADKGSILLEGQELVGKKLTENSSNGVEVVYQEFNLAPQLSVYENIFIGKPIRKGPGNAFVDKAAMIRETRELFTRLGMDIDPEARIDTLSVAYMQFVEIAKAISKKAKVLIMDEPTATLTNAEVEILMKNIRRMKAEGTTIIYVSHRMEEIFEITDRCSVLRDGKYIATVNTAETSREELIRYMVGRELVETFPSRDAEIGEVVLEVKGLYGNGVSNVNFELHKGEILGFGGLVGAGRTETAEMLFGAARVEKGDIILKGKKVTMHHPREAIRNGIALIPEDRKQHGLILDKSIMENMTLPVFKRLSTMQFLDKKKQIDLTNEQVEALRVKTPTIDQLAKNLSGGNQQKVVLGKWLIAESDIVIFDEPTRGIDVGAKQEIYKLMNQLVENGKAIIMISSEMPELLGMSDRLVVFSEKRQVGVLEKEELDQAVVLDMASGDK
ncbi:MAG: sugar ABC transporter ATP-binding protein [Blautia sp.]|nr:sugar ABC transporter ATP-binding protein [Blautia sp.]